MESLGYIEFLINILKGITDKDITSQLQSNADEEKINLINEIIRVTLMHIKLMCLYNSGRCEQVKIILTM